MSQGYKTINQSCLEAVEFRLATSCTGIQCNLLQFLIFCLPIYCLRFVAFVTDHKIKEVVFYLTHILVAPFHQLAHTC